MTIKQLNEEDLLKPFYRYNAEKHSWEYLDTEYGWVKVSSKEDAFNDAKHTAIVLGNSYLAQVGKNAPPEGVPPPELITTRNGAPVPSPPAPPPTRKVKDFTFTNGELWIIIALVLGMFIGVYISRITGACI
ncbi:MAG: hypothetical protein RR280_00965 [Bacteroidaceae bacterium]